jgi:phosphatidylserine/phosphatidylglycerophosphate/cardiolipin synthase-like enzyme
MTTPAAVLDLAPHLQERLAGALQSGMLKAPYPASSIRATLGLTDDAQAVCDCLVELDSLGLSGPAAANWIRTVSSAAGQARRPDLVWSGPEVPGLHARDTRRVFEELISSAQRSVWACTYAYFDGPKAFELLARRMDETPGLDVTLLLNIQRRRGDTTSEDQLVRAFADRLWKTDWPGSARPRVFFDPRAVDPEGPGGVLHAKAVVADDEAVFVTSANLTEAAFDRNIEMGVLYRDRAFALTVTSHFRVLIDRELLMPLPLE